MAKIPYGKQHIDTDDIRAAVNVMKSDWLTQGPDVYEFEKALAKYCGAKFAVAVSSGTAALHIACLSAGIKERDEAITTPITFLATPNSVLYAGATPIFADIEHKTVNIDTEDIISKLSEKTKAILPVHFAGLPAKMPDIRRIAKKNDLIVIEDACHALGAEYKYRNKWIKVGSCAHSDMTVFSFHPVKAITTGEGGAVLTNSKELYCKLCSLRSHGTYKDAITARQGGWVYEMRQLGFNYRITDIQCAVGKSQLKKIDSFIIKREKIASLYDEAFKNIVEIIPGQYYSKSNFKHARHLYLLRLDMDKIGINKKEIFEILLKKNIGIQVHYMPVYKQPFYRKNGYNKVCCSNSEKYYDQAFSLPIYPDLSLKDANKVIRAVKELVKNNKI